MRRVGINVVLLAGSALLQTFIFPVSGPLPFWRAQLAWIALVPWLLMLCMESKRGWRPLRRLTALSYLCGVLWYAGHCYWIQQTMHLYGSMSSFMADIVLLLFCMYLGLYHALFGFLAALLARVERTRSVLPLLLATLWVAVELARAHITSFPWDLLGYSQIDNAGLTRLAPWAGTYAISFIVALGNALIACSLYASRSSGLKKAQRAPLLTAGLILAAACICLGIALHVPQPSANQSAVLVQPDLAAGSDTAAALTGVPLDLQLAGISEAAVRAAATQADTPHLILWPEAPTSYELHQPQLQAVLTSLAAGQSSTVIANANAVDPDQSQQRRYRLYNAAALFTSQGMQDRYEKIHLVPFGEFVPYASLFSFAGGLTEQVGSFDRGNRRHPLTDGVHHYGTFICYESIFPDEIRQFALHGADVLVNLSDDGWYGDTSAPFQHSNMARMRAIENRRWLLRDTNTGITESIDPFGNVRETAPRHRRLAVTMHYAYTSDLTFYTRHGDWFAYLCTIIALVALAYGLIVNSPGR